MKISTKFAAAVLLLLTPACLSAFDGASSATSQPEAEDQTTPAEAKPASERLTIHGFLTQAYAVANYSHNDTLGVDGPASPEVSLGIPEDGTTDYSSLALQISYDLSPKDRVVVQLSHEANGTSPADAFRDEIELDWAFYSRKIGDASILKVGRVPIPFGIYNEIRDVGVLLPFYRPSYAVYLEGTYTSETLDGLQLSNQFTLGDWSLDFDLYAGEFSALEGSPLDPDDLKPVRARNILGTQIWLNTPVSGLRVGASGHRKVFSGGQEGVYRPVGADSVTNDYMLSVEADMEKWSLRGEYRFIRPEETAGGGFTVHPIKTDFESWYAQLGWKITRSFHLYLQAEGNHTTLKSLDFLRDVENNSVDDTAIALYYSFSPNLVLKGEYHELTSGTISFAPVFTPQGVRVEGVRSEYTGGSYGIVSVAVSF